MKQFLVFAMDTCYPCGGWYDFVGAYDTLDEACQALRATSWDFGHVVNTKTMTISYKLTTVLTKEI